MEKYKARIDKLFEKTLKLLEHDIDYNSKVSLSSVEALLVLSNLNKQLTKNKRKK